MIQRRRSDIIATRQLAAVDELTNSLIRNIGDQPGALELWMAPRSGVPWFWLIVAPIDDDAERSIYRQSAVVYDEVDDALFNLHIVNPRFYVDGTDPRQIVPGDARLIVAFSS
ncbi:MAG TPA: hypothetical protein VMM78_10590 [Thermomicrobiales bacterium]|nr:hypothetical protein [Thermomicrobiales bacterium]